MTSKAPATLARVMASPAGEAVRASLPASIWLGLAALVGALVATGFILLWSAHQVAAARRAVSDLREQEDRLSENVSRLAELEARVGVTLVDMGGRTLFLLPENARFKRIVSARGIWDRRNAWALEER